MILRPHYFNAPAITSNRCFVLVIEHFKDPDFFRSFGRKRPYCCLLGGFRDWRLFSGVCEFQMEILIIANCSHYYPSWAYLPSSESSVQTTATEWITDSGQSWIAATTQFDSHSLRQELFTRPRLSSVYGLAI